MPQNRPETEKLWELMATYQPLDAEGLLRAVADHLEFSQSKIRYTATHFDLYQSLALSIRDRLVEFWNDTQQTYRERGAKQVYYLSLEYLVGRSLRNNLVNLGIYEVCQDAMAQIGYDLEELEELEHDAGLGNGGLGRLAACFLDSMATLQLPAQGYGIRYEYGIFEQRFRNGEQLETPDNWLEQGYPWEIPRHELTCPVQFYGTVEPHPESPNGFRKRWIDTEPALAVAYDVPIAGYQNRTVNNLRLWQARASRNFDFHAFNRGDYLAAVAEQQQAETISKVLYPNDQGFSGKELRLKQQYFFVSASLQDLLGCFCDRHTDWNRLPEQVAIQLNDTHPSIAIAELMRLLVDEEGLEWNHAWGLTTRTFAYTNHTVLPEALEKWSVDLLGHLLPRHLEIIYEINKHFLSEVVKIRPDDGALLNRISLIEESNPKQVRMPHLAIVGSHAVNGVAALHTELLKTTVFRDFHSLFPERFQNKTNGITPRLWLKCANPELADLITEQIGASWVTDLEQLQKLRGKSEDKVFQEAWRTVRRRKKAQFAEWLQQMHGLSVDPQTRFDVQIKRIHEYKRQLLNLLHVLHDYLRLKDNPNLDLTPRTVILAGKAAPGYHMAKEIIRLAIAISQLLDQDARVHEKLRLVFVPNYGVAAAQKLIPAADLSQHISTAGTEASGTSNMKFVLNGAPILGTLDGANIEILAAVGAENGFIFGLTTPEVQEVREGGYNPEETLRRNPELKAALKLLVKGKLASGKGEGFRDLHDSLVFSDHYLLLADFASYAECHERVESAWRDPERWTRMSIQNIAGAGSFSSDRTIRQYAEEIWNLRAVPVKSPV